MLRCNEPHYVRHIITRNRLHARSAGRRAFANGVHLEGKADSVPLEEAEHAAAHSAVEVIEEPMDEH